MGTETILATGLAPAKWPSALYLDERPDGSGTDTPAGPLRRWAGAFGSTEALGRALPCVGLDLDLLRRRLGEPVANTPAPGWVRAAAEAATRGAEGAEPYLADNHRLGLLAALGPLVRCHQRQLHAEVGAVVAGSPAAGRLTALADLLAGAVPFVELSSAAIRTMVLELNVARVEGRLDGSSPESRFAAFLAHLGTPQAQAALWDEYPVLLRYLVEVLGNWRTASLEFAARLVDDLADLDALVPGREGLGVLTGVAAGEGDRHRGGRSVAVVTFGGGKVVYKPRPLDVDLAWDRVLNWFNASGAPYELISPWVVARAGYGWVGFVEYRHCDRGEEVSAFYWRLGALLALVHALWGIDFHAENLIAAGAHPVLIDLEALFHGARPAGVADEWMDAAAELFDSSVVATGLLPSKMVVRNDGVPHVFEFSALSVPEEQMSVLPVPTAIDNGTDEMRFVDQRAPMPMANSRPRLGESLVDPARYEPVLLAGFTWAYRAVMADRDRWLASDGLVDGFAGAQLRYIARPTAFYLRMLLDSLHPDFLRDAAERHRALARLAVGADGSGTWERLVASELADMRGGDIPFFTAEPGSRSVWDSRGHEIECYFEQSPLSLVRERIAAMSTEAGEVQCLLIRHTFQSRRVGNRAEPVTWPLPAEPLTRAEARAAAGEVARDLARRAVRGPRGIGWVALHYVDDVVWQAGPAGLDCYAGVPGIGLFLSTAAAATGDDEVAAAATAVADLLGRRAVEFAEKVARELTPGSLLAQSMAKSADAGVLGAAGGLIYYLSHAGSLHGRTDLWDAAERMLAVLAHQVEFDTSYDVIGGGGGAILACLALHAVRPGSSALRLAERAAARVIAAAESVDGGLAWPSPAARRPLTGMAHGAGGIAFALARLHSLAPSQRYVQAIDGALRYEQACFDPDAGNWPDYRLPEFGGSDRPMVAWCHGAPGIAFSRMALLGAPLPDSTRELAAAHVDSAERLLSRETFGSDRDRFHSQGNNVLCHGDLGNLELLMLLAHRRGDQELARRCLRGARAVVEHGRPAGWSAGPVPADALPGLLYGMAGIGYNLLRLSDMESTPSVLLLEPPKRAGAGHGTKLPSEAVEGDGVPVREST